MKCLVAIAALMAATQLHAGSARLKSRSSGYNHYLALTESSGRIHKIVQFEAAPSREQLTALEKAGATIVAYVPDDAVLVSIDAALPIAIDAVRSAYAMPAADKISPALTWGAGGILAIVEFHADVDAFSKRSAVLRTGLE